MHTYHITLAYPVKGYLLNFISHLHVKRTFFIELSFLVLFITVSFQFGTNFVLQLANFVLNILIPFSVLQYLVMLVN